MKTDHVVVDSCAFLKYVKMDEIAENVYTCPSVVSEVRDRQARKMLSVLPYELIIKSPSPTSLNKIVKMSKQTGDYRSLSRTDMELIALTYELCLAHDPDSINQSVSKKNDSIQMGGSSVADLSIPGFYLPSNIVGDSLSALKLEEPNSEGDVEEEQNINEEQEHGTVDENVVEINEVEDCDESGWITPTRLRELNSRNLDDEQPVKVSCLTQDFAMQNLLKKMNLGVISVDGRVITMVRSHVLRCHACFEVTKVMTKIFCPKCGNKTLKRVPVELNEKGEMKMFFSRNPKVLNPKGLRHPIPHPRGGKHSNNPILVEDQRVPMNKPSRKSMMKTNVWAENYECGASPFAVRDTESRAFRLGIRPTNQRRSGSAGTRFLKKR